MVGLVQFQIVGTKESWAVVASDNRGVLWYGTSHVGSDDNMEINWKVMKENFLK